MLKTPVVIIVYNRPNLTKKLLNKLSIVKPKNLVIISDGAKPDQKDIKKVLKIKKIVKQINWKCKKLYISSKKNLGLKKRVHSGLNIVFQNYNKAIIFEDDCIPNKSFFFCEKLLDLYKNNKKISTISGNKFNSIEIKNSYYFSKYSSIWGWASWKRSWNSFDIKIKFWPKYKKSKRWIKDFPDIVERIFWEKKFDKVYNGTIKSWAYPFLLNNFYHRNLTIIPKYNLVKNIGFGVNATHTKYYNKDFLPNIKKINYSI